MQSGSTIDLCSKHEIFKLKLDKLELRINKRIQADLVIRGFLSADLLIHECKISLKGHISSQNVSFYLQIQYSRFKIAGRIYLE
jgi:hypothetical protein